MSDGFNWIALTVAVIVTLFICRKKKPKEQRICSAPIHPISLMSKHEALRQLRPAYRWMLFGSLGVWIIGLIPTGFAIDRGIVWAPFVTIALWFIIVGVGFRLKLPEWARNLPEGEKLPGGILGSMAGLIFFAGIFLYMAMGMPGTVKLLDY